MLFLIVGASVMIAGYFADAEGNDERPEPWEADVQAALITIETRTKRAPSETEAAGLRESVLDTEALVREARALGLDRDDHIVRGRLAQKRRALARGDTAPDARDPHVTPAPSGQSTVARFSFQQVFFSRHGGADAVTRRVEDARTALSTGTAADTLGDPFIRGHTFTDVDQEYASRVFGPAFARGLGDMPEGTWSTVESTYGTHLVRLNARTAALPAERAARDARVEADARGREAERALLEGLRARHAIHREAGTEDTP